ncbi:MAG: trigger factor [Planctomycetota bacterium]
MQIDVTDVGPLRKQITVSYTADEFASRQSEMLDGYAKQAKLKGFRNGRAPRSVLEKRYGEAVRAQAMDEMVNKAVQQGLSDHDLRPVGPFEQGEPETEEGLRYTTSFDIRPDVQLPDPESLSVDSLDTGASPEEIEEEIGDLLRRAGQARNLEQGEQLQRNDSLTLAGRITAGEETVRDVHDLNHCLGAYPLFGTDPEQVVELFEAHKVGDTVSFDTTLPDTFRPEEWAGKDAHVAVTVQSADRQEPAQLDEDLFQRFGVENEEELRTRITESITSRKDNEQHQQQLQQLTDQLIERSEFDLPQHLLDTLVENQVEQAVQRAKQQDENADEAAIRAEEEPKARENASTYLRRSFILSTIAEDNQIEASQQDLQQQIMMAAYQSGQNPQDIVKNLQESGQLQQVAMEIREAKALEHYLALVKGDDPSAEAAGAQESAPAAAATGSDDEG